MASLTEILPQLRQHSAILVTGPQRSGTTIGAHIIATELGYEYIDEECVGISKDALAREALTRNHVVLQAPALCHVAHTFDCAVVLMRRDVPAIIRSQGRIAWDRNEAGELRKYGATKGPIADVKYCAWEQWQKAACKAPYELDYESLSSHRLWVLPEQRSQFGKRQWRT